MRLLVGRSARQEIRDARDCYASQTAELARDFALAVEHALTAIASTPTLWPPYTHRSRRYPLKRFPYAVIYRAEPEIVRIVAVAHQSRNPTYWIGR